MLTHKAPPDPAQACQRIAVALGCSYRDAYHTCYALSGATIAQQTVKVSAPLTTVVVDRSPYVEGADDNALVRKIAARHGVRSCPDLDAAGTRASLVNAGSNPPGVQRGRRADWRGACALPNVATCVAVYCCEPVQRLLHVCCTVQMAMHWCAQCYTRPRNTMYTSRYSTVAPPGERLLGALLLAPRRRRCPVWRSGQGWGRGPRPHHAHRQRRLGPRRQSRDG